VLIKIKVITINFSVHFQLSVNFDKLYIIIIVVINNHKRFYFYLFTAVSIRLAQNALVERNYTREVTTVHARFLNIDEYINIVHKYKYINT